MKLTKTIALSLAVMGTLALGACGTNVNLSVKSVKLTEEQYAFAIQKGSSLVAQVNSILTEMKADTSAEGLDGIINSFFDGTATFEYSNPDVATPKANDSKYFVVGTNAYFPPFEYKSEGKFTGIDMKIANVIATKLNKTLYIVDTEFSSLIAGVQAGDYDIAMAGMTVTETRKQQVDFADPYYTSAQVITVKEGDTTYDNCKTAADVEAILAEKGSNYKIGTQNGTTGYMYAAGDEDFGYTGFKNLTVKGYKTGALAMTDLKNGAIDAVILDEQPSKMIVASFNK